MNEEQVDTEVQKIIAAWEKELGSEVGSCERCGKPCRKGQSNNPNAAPLRRTDHGYCPNCALTDFIKGIDVLMFGIEKNGVTMLLKPMIQDEFAALFRIGKSDTDISEIDWQWLVDHWDLPFPPKRLRRKAKRKASR